MRANVISDLYVNNLYLGQTANHNKTNIYSTHYIIQHETIKTNTKH